MTGIGAALDAIDKFIKIGKELTKLPAFILPQYKIAAVSLYQICQKLLQANENIARWLFRFQYFDFQGHDAKARFLDLCQQYNTMKMGPERRELKFRCGDIALIYRRDIASKVGAWFTNQHRAAEAEIIFTELANADGNMIELIDNLVIGQIDVFTRDIEKLIQLNDLDSAEAARLRFRTGMGPVNRELERFSEALSDLLLQFAQIGGVPVTLANQ